MPDRDSGGGGFERLSRIGEKWIPLGYSFGRRYGLSHHDAEEELQEAMKIFCTGAARAGPLIEAASPVEDETDCALRYLCGIMKNRIKSFWRKRNTVPPVVSLSVVAEPTATDVDDDDFLSRVISHIEDCIAAGDRGLEALYEKCMHGVTFEETAHRMRRASSSVRQDVHRSKEKIRNQFSADCS